MQQFQVSRLVGEAARLAYPLVRESEPDIPLESWLHFARRTASPRVRDTGIMVATRIGKRFPSGLFCYRCHRDPALGKIITADHFVAVDILDPAPVADVMVQALEELGTRLSCQAVRSVVHHRANVLSDCLRTSGHRMEATNFVKYIGGVAEGKKAVLF